MKMPAPCSMQQGPGTGGAQRMLAIVWRLEASVAPGDRRVGDTTVAVAPDEYSRVLFERMHSEQPWENQPAAGWSVRDGVPSSGTLHFRVTPVKLFAPHEFLPGNPLIARTFYRRGLIEEMGLGTLKIAEVKAQAGLPRPEIEDAGGCVTVRFRRAKAMARLDDRSGAGDRVRETTSGERRTSAAKQRAQAADDALRVLRARFSGATIEEILEMRNEGRS